MVHTRWLTAMSKIHRGLSRLLRFGEPGLNGVTRGSIGMNVSWGRSHPHIHTRAREIAHARAWSCLPGRQSDGRAPKSLSPRWLAGVHGSRKKKKVLTVLTRRISAFSPFAWTNIHLYFTAEIAKSRNERCAREREFNSLLREFEKVSHS